MILTEKEIVRQWLLRKGLEPLRSDCTITRSDGVDIEKIATLECRLWYEKLLATAPVDLLVPHDIANSNDLKISLSTAGGIMISLPSNCIRPVAVKLSGWLAPATIVTPDSPLARLQSNPFTAGGIVNPVAIIHPDNRLELFSPANKTANKPESLLCILRQTTDDDPDELIYEFRPAALASL